MLLLPRLSDAKDRLRKVVSAPIDDKYLLGKERVTRPRIMAGQTALKGKLGVLSSH